MHAPRQGGKAPTEVAAPHAIPNVRAKGTRGMALPHPGGGYTWRARTRPRRLPWVGTFGARHPAGMWLPGVIDPRIHIFTGSMHDNFLMVFHAVRHLPCFGYIMDSHEYGFIAKIRRSLADFYWNKSLKHVRCIFDH